MFDIARTSSKQYLPVLTAVENQKGVQANDLAGIRGEALDLAAVCVRLSEQVDDNDALRKRSVK